MKNTIIRLGLLAACGLTLVGLTVAQDTKAVEPRPEIRQPNPNRPRDNQGNMLRQLGLSSEQIQQIRRIKMEQRPSMDEAQRRFREANRALDEAIYADQVNDADFQARLSDVQAAQGEVQRLRFMNELAVRRILTQEQLVKFRELRERFEQARETMQERRQFRDRGIRQMERQMLRNERPTNEPPHPVKQQPQRPIQ